MVIKSLFLVFVVIAAVFLWLAPKLISGIGYLVRPPSVAVEHQAALAGKVAVCSTNRRKYLYALEGRRETFDFGGFQNEVLWEGGRLSTHLENGDLVQKKANSDTLRVTRKGQRSNWTTVPQAAGYREWRSIKPAKVGPDNCRIQQGPETRTWLGQPGRRPISLW